MRNQMAKRTSLLNSGRSKTLGGAYKDKWHCSHVRYYSRIRYCLRYCSRHCSHRRIDDVALTDVVALTDEVSRSCWAKILMYCWWWRGSISVDEKSRVRCMHHTGLFSTKPRYCSTWVKPCYCSFTWSNRVLLTDDVAQSWVSKLFLIRWSWFTPCIYKKGASPP